MSDTPPTKEECYHESAVSLRAARTSLGGGATKSAEAHLSVAEGWRKLAETIAAEGWRKLAETIADYENWGPRRPEDWLLTKRPEGE